MNLSLRHLAIALVVIGCAAAAGVSRGVSAARTDQAVADLHLVLNVAGNRLDVYEKGKLTTSFGVSVGMPGFETPPGEYYINEVIWNPWWHPPNSKWAEGRKPEPPGAPTNPMGRVKLNFAPLLYIHGTPEYQTLGQPSSRGCIRMRNAEAIELTRIVHKYGSPDFKSATLERLIASPKLTQNVRLKKPIRLTAQYQIAKVDNGFLVIYPDVYRRVGTKLRSQVEAVLKQSGIDPRDVNRERLDQLLEKSSRTRVVMELDSLVTVAGGGSRPDR